MAGVPQQLAVVAAAVKAPAPAGLKAVGGAGLGWSFREGV